MINESFKEPHVPNSLARPTHAFEILQLEAEKPPAAMNFVSLGWEIRLVVVEITEMRRKQEEKEEEKRKRKSKYSCEKGWDIFIHKKVVKRPHQRFFTQPDKPGKRDAQAVKEQWLGNTLSRARRQ